MLIKLGRAFAVAGVLAVASGCAANNGYQKAFAAESAIKGNHQTFYVPADQTFRAVKMTLVRQGFTIENADAAAGLIKAVRNFQDVEDKDVSYNIIATADVTADDDNSVVTIAASQQTVLHREWHTWWHLLWIIPLFPTGTEYQTVVTQEGNVTDASFYKDFFASVDNVVKANIEAARAKALKLEAERAAAAQAAAAAEAAATAAALAATPAAEGEAAKPVPSTPTTSATPASAPDAPTSGGITEVTAPATDSSNAPATTSP